MNVDKYLVQATPPSIKKNTYLKKYFHNSQVLLGGPIICSSSVVNIYQLTKIKDSPKMLWHSPKPTKDNLLCQNLKKMCKSAVSLDPMLFNWLELSGLFTARDAPNFLTFFAPFCKWIHAHKDLDMCMYPHMCSCTRMLAHVAACAWPSIVYTLSVFIC